MRESKQKDNFIVGVGLTNKRPFDNGFVRESEKKN